MKTFIFSILLLSCAATQASNMCSDKAYVFAIAAQARDENYPPQDAYDAIHAKKLDEKTQLSPAGLKQIINTIYFDPDISQFSPKQIAKFVYDACLHAKPNYYPLK